MIPGKDSAYRVRVPGGRVRIPARCPAQAGELPDFVAVPLADLPARWPALGPEAAAAARARRARLGAVFLLAGLVAAQTFRSAAAHPGLLALGPGLVGPAIAACAAAWVALALQPWLVPLPRLPGGIRTRGEAIERLGGGTEASEYLVHDGPLAAAFARANGVTPVPVASRGRGPGTALSWRGPILPGMAAAIAAAVALFAAVGQR